MHANPGDETVNLETDTSRAFEASIFDTLKLATRMTIRDPRVALRAGFLLRQQHAAAKVRRAQRTRGIHVPPFVIYSITGRCNLNCFGCYSNILHVSERPELSRERIGRLLGEARDLGISIMLVAGGEPLLRPDLLELTSQAPEILFLLFTNATLINSTLAAQLKRQPHVIPVLSLEGDESLTDARRGAGAHARVLDAMRLLRSYHVFFGTSTTLTQENYALATSESHLRDLIRRGCKLFYFINYIPVEPGTEDLQLSPERARSFEERLTTYRRSMPSLFIAFPHDEVALGGCLAAGRGFLHINAYGDVEPCPFSPYSDRNLTQASLLEAIESPLLRTIRESDVRLDETDGRCALWKQRDWVERLASERTSLAAPSTSVAEE